MASWLEVLTVCMDTRIWGCVVWTCASSYAYNRDTDEYLAGTPTGVEVWKLTQVN